jgi:hypothetical protein
MRNDRVFAGRFHQLREFALDQREAKAIFSEPSGGGMLSFFSCLRYLRMFDMK